MAFIALGPLRGACALLLSCAIGFAISFAIASAAGPTLGLVSTALLAGTTIKLLVISNRSFERRAICRRRNAQCLSQLDVVGRELKAVERAQVSAELAGAMHLAKYNYLNLRERAVALDALDAQTRLEAKVQRQQNEATTAFNDDVSSFNRQVRLIVMASRKASRHG